MKKLIFSLSVLLLAASCAPKGATTQMPAEVTLTKEVLLDKIKGGWAGQTIGCTYGSVTEFRYNGGIIPDYTPIEWEDGWVKWWFDHSTGLYDDIYMDLTFVDVFERLGLDAPVDSFAMAFATAEYRLWHGNQAARYNILHGVMPPASGHWTNNPHCLDLDYMIESDYSGLMSPGMPNSASEISDKIGHIMSYGDGWYGGVYVGAMYSLAFVSDDMEFVVTEALKTIPAQSDFYQCMSDVIGWWKQYPTDWKRTWFECERKWNHDVGCPGSVFASTNIDATINCAYIIIGLLYGEGDYFKTLDISTRCGQDSDCNPASAGGILGTMIGYSKIPDYWMNNIREVEHRNFTFTNISLNKAYEIGLGHALQMIERGGGSIDGDQVTIKYQEPVAVRYEKAFEGHYPVQNMTFRGLLDTMPPCVFDGIGIAFRGGLTCADTKYVARVECYIDGQLDQTVELPALFHDRKLEPYFRYQLPKGRHELTFKWLNPRKDATLELRDAVVYSDTPRDPYAEHVHGQATVTRK